MSAEPSACGITGRLQTLLKQVSVGDLDVSQALQELELLPFADLGFARVDTHRELRQDEAEAVLAAGKSVEEVTAIVRAMLDADVSSVLVTRADEAQRTAVAAIDPTFQIDERARCTWVVRRPVARRGLVTLISAGTSDGPVLREAQIRAELVGTNVVVHQDAGVAGLHRLVPALDDLRRADCVVAVAGMDAALASVIGGLTAAPVIAVPTSTGYGSAFGGISALLAMLNSCAAGVAVVNIDDGFSAGTVAAKIARAAGSSAR